MIYFDSLEIDGADDPIKQRLYNLFFEWKSNTNSLKFREMPYL